MNGGQLMAILEDQGFTINPADPGKIPPNTWWAERRIEGFDATIYAQVWTKNYLYTMRQNGSVYGGERVSMGLNFGRGPSSPQLHQTAHTELERFASVAKSLGHPVSCWLIGMRWGE